MFFLFLLVLAAPWAYYAVLVAMTDHSLVGCIALVACGYYVWSMVGLYLNSKRIAAAQHQ